MYLFCVCVFLYVCVCVCVLFHSTQSRKTFLKPKVKARDRWNFARSLGQSA